MKIIRKSFCGHAYFVEINYMPPLAPNLSQAATLRTISGWNNSSMSRRSNTMRGLLSTRTPQSSDTTSGGMLNPPLPPSIIGEAMPRGAMGSFTPRVVLRRPSGGGGVIPLANFIGGWNDPLSATNYCIGQNEGVITTGIASIPQILYLWVVIPGALPPPDTLSLQLAMGYKNNILSLFDVSAASNWTDVTTALSGTADGTDTSPTTTTINFIGDVGDPEPVIILVINTATVTCSLTRTPDTPPLPP